jgi:NADP-dependent 3-hydroxy acid dehydrogenase YdfG
VAQTADTEVELGEAEWYRVIRIDLKGVRFGMKTVIPSMIEKRYGRILNIASLTALRGLPNLFSYSTAKVGSRPSLDWEHQETLPIWLHTSRHPKQNSSPVKLFLATAVGRQNKKCGA